MGDHEQLSPEQMPQAAPQAAALPRPQRQRAARLMQQLCPRCARTTQRSQFSDDPLPNIPCKPGNLAAPHSQAPTRAPTGPRRGYQVGRSKQRASGMPEGPALGTTGAAATTAAAAAAGTARLPPTPPPPQRNNLQHIERPCRYLRQSKRRG